MQNLVGKDRVLAELGKALAETLRIEENAVRPVSSIVRDLGADSLDFLDVNYRIEQAFGIKMARQHFLEHVEEMFGEGTAIDENGRLTERALALLRIRYREENLPDLARGLDMEAVPALITVETMAAVVLTILDTLPDRCECGEAAWKSDDGAHITCGGCAAAAQLTNGDELTRQWLAEVQHQAGLAAA
ncbi:MAG: phosphopantetheine-binding protein [Acidobacteriota bacterium]